MEVTESMDFAKIGSWWQGKNNKGQHEIDIIGLYAEDKRELAAEVKRQAKNFKPELFAQKVGALCKNGKFMRNKHK